MCLAGLFSKLRNLTDANIAQLDAGRILPPVGGPILTGQHRGAPWGPGAHTTARVLREPSDLVYVIGEIYNLTDMGAVRLDSGLIGPPGFLPVSADPFLVSDTAGPREDSIPLGVTVISRGDRRGPRRPFGARGPYYGPFLWEPFYLVSEIGEIYHLTGTDIARLDSGHIGPPAFFPSFADQFFAGET